MCRGRERGTDRETERGSPKLNTWVLENLWEQI